MEKVSLVKNFINNTKAKIGLIIILIYMLIAILAPVITSHAPEKRVSRPHQPPSTEYVMGTTRMGLDVYTQAVWGTRLSLSIGIFAGFLVMSIGTIIGLLSGYYGGRIDGVLNFITNVVLVIPSLPLILVLAAFLGQTGPITIALIIGFTSWTWGARVIRAQTMTIRKRDYILASELIGEPHWRIMLVEIVPNLTSIIGINFIGSVIYAVLTEATLEFLGLGDPMVVSWGTMLYNAQNSSALYVGAWWEVFVPSMAIAILSIGMVLLNFGFDEIANPRLRDKGNKKKFNKLIEKHNAGKIPIDE